MSQPSDLDPVSSRTTRRPYLPRGLRKRLAERFGVTVSAVDWRLRHREDETLEAAQLRADTLEAALQMVLHDTGSTTEHNADTFRNKDHGHGH
ncbi:MAG: hypothetical protein J0I17_11315 ['Candidatus Kapabacteria' thiocyanatum]|nr:hypothetical protein ['Candidatus Kapabacteria' thiocyanatum]